MTARARPSRAAAAVAARSRGVRGWVDIYMTDDADRDREQFQYRVANYFYMIGMIAEPVIYLVVWSTVASQQGGEVGGFTAGEFAAYYIVWTLVRNMNIALTPWAWEERIRGGRAVAAMLLRPIHPIHVDLAFMAGWKVVVIILWLPIAAFLSLIFHPTFDAGLDRRRRLLHRDLGRLPDPALAAALDARARDVLDDPGRAGLRHLLHRGAAALRPARAAVPHAGVGPAARRLPAVQVDVRLPDRGADRPAARPRSSSAGWPCRSSGSDRAIVVVDDRLAVRRAAVSSVGG